MSAGMEVGQPPTDEIVPLRKLLVALDMFPELFCCCRCPPGTLVRQFAADLFARCPQLGSCSQLYCLASYGKELYAPDINQISSLTQILLMLLPVAMLRIAITLQHFRRPMVSKTLQNTTSFVFGTLDNTALGRLSLFLPCANTCDRQALA
jgi:hypothetical protein